MRNRPNLKKLHEAEFLISSNPETVEKDALEFSEYLRNKKLASQKRATKSSNPQVRVVNH
ncbi:hypothetical protein [Arcicella lustrica]|uniref:Uncharacterized protein n=1 Tax=Arcicella lustrica TaxID=2984196 RepID=A0ABU5SDP0_9BACT|nr:hypothetical protein [Arcicella sp. DC25W]MEA5425361.1 hypothetical protein [Arcicella sp. DC25W]